MRRALPLIVAAGLLGAVPAAAGPLPCVAIPTLNDRCPTWTRINADTQDFPMDLVAGPELLYHASTSGEWGNAQAAVFATDADTGAAAWSTAIAGAAGRDDAAEALALSSDGSRLFVTGGENLTPERYWNGHPGYPSDLMIAAYDAATGAQLWIAREPGGYGHALAVSPDGATVYLAARGAGHGDAADLATIAFDAATGEERWRASFDGAAHGADRALAIAARDGRVVVTGETRGDGDERDLDAVTIAYDAADGDTLWTHVYDGEDPDYSTDTGQSLALTADALYVNARSGYQRSTALLALDPATGAERWRRMLPAWGFDADVTLNPAGTRIYLTGFESGVGDFGLDRTTAYAASNGAQLWTATFDVEPNTNYAPVAYDAAISPDGATLYVGGVQRKQTSMLAWDYVTVAYDAVTGVRRWIATYQSGSGFIFDDIDIARLIALRPGGGMVYTSGVVWRVQTVTGEPEGIGTLAYPTT